MTTLTRLTLALAVGAFCLPALAAERRPLSPEKSAAHATAAASLQQAPRVRAAGPKGEAAPKVAGTQRRPGTPMANAFRAYPPSCAADPLPDQPSGPTWTAVVPLYAYDGSAEGLIEDVTVTVWRLACSSSGAETDYNPTGAHNGMTLVRIDRDAEYEGDAEIFPTFPVMRVSQGGSFDGRESLPRLALEPNTILSEVVFDTPIIDSATYVLENYVYQGYGYFTFSDGFTLQVDPVIPGEAPVEIDVPPYEPTQASYADAFAPRPLDGYSAAQWVNYEFNEGLLLQVTEQVQPDGTMVRQVVFDLLIEDTNGDPLWLIGNAAFPVNARSLEIDLAYLGNGLAQIPWGTATIEVADCNHIDVDFAPVNNLLEPIPSFSGVTTYERLFTPNGMTCE